MKPAAIALSALLVGAVCFVAGFVISLVDPTLTTSGVVLMGIGALLSGLLLAVALIAWAVQLGVRAAR